MLNNDCINACTGCGACSAACPVKAISMHESVFGNGLAPMIDADVCISCGKCEKVHYSLQSTLKRSLGITFGAKLMDEKLRAQSSSGGIFSALAYAVLNDKGLVVGAAFDSNLVLRHVVVSSADELAPLRGSKYLQSRIDDGVLRQVRAALIEERSVLFVGTPCQIAGLRAYLQDICQDNLIAVDLVCHGSPSQSVFDSYIDDLERQYRGRALECQFRNKESRYGWSNVQVCVQFDNGAKSVCSFRDKDAYGRAFIDNLLLRPSCYNCQFKGADRASDITLGDFWGVENIHSNEYDISGVSLVIANTEIGVNALRDLKSLAYCFETTPDAINNNGGYISVSRMNAKRNDAIRDLESGCSFGAVVNKYPNEGKLNSVVRYLIRKGRDVYHLALSKNNGF